MAESKIIDGVDYSDRDDSLDADGYYKVPRTFAELSGQREFSTAVAMSGGQPAPKFTCDHCTRAFRCQWAYDLYNTDGDCLDDK